jgi:hypothetical protein
MWSRYVQRHLGKVALANLRTVQVTALLDHYANNGLIATRSPTSSFF